MRSLLLKLQQDVTITHAQELKDATIVHAYCDFMALFLKMCGSQELALHIQSGPIYEYLEFMRTNRKVILVFMLEETVSYLLVLVEEMTKFFGHILR